MVEIIDRLAIVILAVQDVARSRNFYAHALGWEVHVDEPVYAELQDGEGMRLGLYDRAAYTANTETPIHTSVPAGAVASTELYFLSEDLDASMARLQAAGARRLTDVASRSWGDEAAYFADPDGNVVVMARPTRT
jgi:catechol 2,3-dioxygenase-like lactoylglutathione lyase family enzyme